MSEYKILVVEDDRPVRNLIAMTMEAEGYSCITAPDGLSAVSLAASHNPDLILLDLGLPDIDGTEVIEKVRSWSLVPIIVISAREEDADKIAALDLGADDYLTKPFSVDELKARIRAAMRRRSYITGPDKGNAVFINGPLRIDYAAGVVCLNDKELHLTAIEYKLLRVLAENVGKVLTHAFLIRSVWGTGVDTDIISLRVYMTSLRKKLRTSGEPQEMIRTHIGIGYQMQRL